MANITITSRNTNGVVLFGATFDERTLTAAGAETWPAGAVLGRVTASGKYVRFDPAAADGSEVPSAVLTQPVEFTAAGDRVERPLISGRVYRGKLVDSNGAAITDAAVFALQDYSIIATGATQGSIADNS